MRRFAFLAFLLGAACHRPSSRGDFALRVAVTGPLEPFSASVSNTYMAAAQDLVFDTFLMPDEHGALISRVLRRWERIDGRHFRIQLDPDLRFSDGSPVHTEDAIASLAAQQLRGTLRGEWLEVEPFNPSSLAEPTLLLTILHKKIAAGYVGTGPFRLVEQTEARLVLERVHSLPRRIGRVEILAFPTPRDVFARVIRGEVNGALGVDERQLELLDGIPHLKPIRNLGPGELGLLLNPYRLDAPTRRQLRAALPLSDIARAFSVHCGMDPAPPRQHPELPPGPPLEILVPRFAASLDRAALALRRSLGSRGGEIARQGLSQTLERLKAGQFDVAVAVLSTWPDSAAAAFWQTGSPMNYLHYSNARIDAAYASGDFIAAKAELEFDVPIIPLCRHERIGVVDSRIKNPRMGWWGNLDTLPEWEVAE